MKLPQRQEGAEEFVTMKTCSEVQLIVEVYSARFGSIEIIGVVKF